MNGWTEVLQKFTLLSAVRILYVLSVYQFSTYTIQGNRRLHFTGAVHSRHPLIPADGQCGLSSTCRRRTKPRTQATCTKICKDRACG